MRLNLEELPPWFQLCLIHIEHVAGRVIERRSKRPATAHAGVGGPSAGDRFSPLDRHASGVEMDGAARVCGFKSLLR